MVATRQDKNKLSFIPKNLKYLRKKKNVTLLELANELSLKGKSSYLAYEEGRAVPDIFKLMSLASYFEVSLDELTNKDLTKQNEESVSTQQNQFEIELVPFSAAAGYAKGFGDLDIRQLDKIKIPFRPYGITRAFEINGDSMEPAIRNGSRIVAIQVSPVEVKKNKAYIIVKQDGIQCKYIQFNEDNSIAYLISANPEHRMKHIETNEIKELWEVWKVL